MSIKLWLQAIQRSWLVQWWRSIFGLWLRSGIEQHVTVQIHSSRIVNKIYLVLEFQILPNITANQVFGLEIFTSVITLEKRTTVNLN
jgi:hypothetical protein